MKVYFFFHLYHAYENHLNNIFQDQLKLSAWQEPWIIYWQFAALMEFYTNHPPTSLNKRNPLKF